MTQEQWKSVMGNNPSYYEGDDLPVEKVSWEDCQKFCRTAGMGLHLPTEAEWEYACRAGSEGAFAGTGNLDELGWFEDNSDKKTHPVGEKEPNEWGVYDMHGNVVEWCSDWYGNFDADAETNPKGSISGTKRVSRGSSYCHSARTCRSAYRFATDPSKKYIDTGFRVICLALDEVFKQEEGQRVELELVRCPICGAKHKVEETFRCGGCGREHLCLGHQDKETYYCEECAGEKEAELEPSDEKTITLPGGAELELVWCPAGTFIMGSPEDEEGRKNNEDQHQVTLTRGFWMGKYPVTQSQWKSVMGNNLSHHKGDDFPVENVSWEDCQRFCRNTGLGLRLPTEAEWEYACRAGSDVAFAGTGNLDGMGWFKVNSDNETHPVGEKEPNEWGLYDMHGNVFEWCADWIDVFSSNAVTNPMGPMKMREDIPRRIMRGGCFVSAAEDCRSAFRLYVEPQKRIAAMGFRVCCFSLIS